MHHARGDHLGKCGAPQRPQQVRAPLHLIGECRYREIETEALVALALAM